MTGKAATVARRGAAIGVTAGTGYAAFSSTPLLIALAVVGAIALTIGGIVVLTAARSDKKHRQKSAHDTLRTVLDFVLRLAGRDPLPPPPPGPLSAAVDAHAARTHRRPVRSRQDAPLAATRRRAYPA